MMRPLSEAQVRALRLRAQWLLAPQAASVEAVVKALGGVQAQDAAAAALAVRARLDRLVAADVEQALVEDRSIVRTWCQRGTLHLIAAEDLGWLLGLLGPVFVRSSRGRRAELGLDEDTEARALRALRAVLGAHGPLTRAEIVAQLARRRVRLEGQARPHLLRLAALEAIICHGPSRGREPTYVLLSDWIKPGPAWPREKALAELARRYLTAYAPATPEDFAAWSGLSLGEARDGWQRLADQLTEVRIGASPAWRLKTQAGRPIQSSFRQPHVRLIPSYDTYLLGYRDRDLIIALEHAQRIYPGGGLLHPALLINGWAGGRWKIRRQRGRLEVVVQPFEALPAGARRGLDAEVEALAHFFGTPATLTVSSLGAA